MSFDLVRHAEKVAEGSGYARALLCRLASYGDRKGRSFYRIETLAERMGFSRSTIKRAMGELIALGYVSRKARRKAKGKQGANLYTVHIGPTAATAPARLLPLMAVVKPSTQSTGGRDAADSRGSIRTAEPAFQRFPQNHHEPVKESLTKADAAREVARRPTPQAKQYETPADMAAAMRALADDLSRRKTG